MHKSGINYWEAPIEKKILVNLFWLIKYGNLYVHPNEEISRKKNMK